MLLGLVLVLSVLPACDGGGSNGTPPAVCGNGQREYGEECDDGNTLPGDFCTPDCKRPNAICGNGITEGTEECDDGNLANGDGCDFTCFIEDVTPDADTGPDLPDLIDAPDLDVPTDRTDADVPPDTTGDDVPIDPCIDGTCPVIECDLWDSTSCEFAEKCTLVGIDRVCVPAGTYTEGQICRSEEECGVGMSCLANGGSDRLCFRFCRDDFDCFGTGSLCVYDLSYGEDTVVPGVRLCSKSCDPISNMGCPDTFACMIYQEDGGFNRFLTDCDPHSGEGRDSDPCEGDVDCAPGFFCMPGENTCVRYCVYPTGYCVVGTCNAFIPTVQLGMKEYGYCWE